MVGLEPSRLSRCNISLDTAWRLTLLGQLLALLCQNENGGYVLLLQICPIVAGNLIQKLGKRVFKKAVVPDT